MDFTPQVLDQIEHAGKVYEVPLPERRHFAELGRWLEDAALRKIEDQQRQLPPETFERRYDAMVRLVGSGAFEPGQPEYVRGAASLEGTRQLLLILLRSKYPDFPESALVDLFAPFWAQVQEAARRAAEQARKQHDPQQTP